MEVKGDAKAITWREARRRFYWYVRARVARSAAMAALEEASPESTHEYHQTLLESTGGIEDEGEPRATAEAPEKPSLMNTATQPRADYLARQMLELAREDGKATVDGLVRVLENLSYEERSALLRTLQSNCSPGA